jgi:cytochrome c5
VNRKWLAIGVALAAFWLAAGASTAGTAMAQNMEQSGAQPELGKVSSSNPYSGDPDAILEGNKLYFKWCAGCHGEHADGVSRFGAYAGNLTKFWRGYAEFIAIAIKGRTENMMPPWGGILDGMQLSKIGAFLETKAVKGANWK